MALHLTAAGLEPVRVGGGEVGLARLRHERPDVLVLDLMLPGLDGWSLIEQARAEGIGTPILVVSAPAPRPARGRAPGHSARRPPLSRPAAPSTTACTRSRSGPTTPWSSRSR